MKTFFRRSSLTKKDGVDDTKLRKDEIEGRFTAKFNDLGEVDFLYEFPRPGVPAVICEVHSGSASAAKGLAVGDQIVQVGGKDVSKMTQLEFSSMLKSMPAMLTLEKSNLPVAQAVAQAAAVLPLAEPSPPPPRPPKSEINQTQPFTPTVGGRFDVLHRVPINNELRDAPAVPPAEFPPEPKTGWRWRPCTIEKIGSPQNGQIMANVTFEDDLPLHYPRSDIVNLGDRCQFCAPLGLKSPAHLMHHNYRSDDILDVLDVYRGKNTGKTMEKWRKCQIVAVAPYFIRVTFSGWNRGFDTWIHVMEEANRLAPFGEHTEIEEAEDSSREKDFRQKMMAKGLKIVNVVPDGNCLFRSVSLLLFGNETRHGEIRRACCDYMESQPKRFEFLVAEGEKFADYVMTMRQDKCWGDEPELRVIEEIYDRPILMFSCDIVGLNDNHDVTQPLEHYSVGEEVVGLENTEPLRLSFHGNNHYNAVVKANSVAKFDPEPEKNKQRIRRHRLLQNGGSLEAIPTLRHHASSFSLRRSNSTVSNIGK